MGVEATVAGLVKAFGLDSGNRRQGGRGYLPVDAATPVATTALPSAAKQVADALFGYVVRDFDGCEAHAILRCKAVQG